MNYKYPDSPLSEIASSITLNTANREVLRITADGRLVTGEGLSVDEATQEAAKLLIASFEEQIQKMVEKRIAAEREVEHALRAEVEQKSNLLVTAIRSAGDQAARAERAEAELACEKENRNHLIEKGAKLETELAAAKAECKRLINQRDNLLKPLRARAEDRADAADEKVERLTSENEKLTIERDALANGSAIEIARLRAELAVAKNWVEHHSKHADDLIAENVKLRADLERFTGHGLLDCHAICDQRDAAIARAERAYVERLKKQIRDDNLGYACEL